MPKTATKPTTEKASNVVELDPAKKDKATATDDFATAIAECEQKIKDIKALKKGNASVQKKREKEIASLEKEILKQTCLRDFEVGDYVTTSADKGRLGVILDIINGNLLEYLISWEGTVTPMPSAFDVVTKVGSEQVKWQWKEGRLIREFDFLECNDLTAIDKELSPIQKKRDQASKKKVTYLTALWNGLVKNVFSKDDLVRYENRVYIITGHKEPAKSQLSHCLAKPHGAEEKDIILVNPVELEVLSMSQQYLNIAAVREYPCQMELLISELTIDQRLQQRVKYNKEAIATYQENVDQMPPVKVILDHLGNFWLWDGFHTVYACKAIEKLTVTADVEKGDFDEAFLRSLGANSKRGVQRTKADRQRAAIQALRAREDGTLLDEKGKRPSNRWIAERIENISRGTIDALYNQLYQTPKEPKEKPQQQELITDTGKGKKGKDAKPANKTTKSTTKGDDEQALADSQSKQHNLPETGATVEPVTTASNGVTATSTVIQDSFVDVSKATERAKIVYEVGEVVYIRNDAEDPQLRNLIRQNALIEDSGEFAVTIRLWSGKTLNVPKNDIAKTQAKIPSVVQISQENYAQLMRNFDSWEAATKGINEILQHALSPVTASAEEPKKSSSEKK